MEKMLEELKWCQKIKHRHFNKEMIFQKIFGKKYSCKRSLSYYW